MRRLRHFSKDELHIIDEAVTIAEEVSSNAYKMSPGEWRGRRYDVRTLADLKEDEIVHGPFAQIVRYLGRKPNTFLSSAEYDFYKICLQDHTILATVDRIPDLRLLAFALYIVTHELIHVIRFAKFLQAFDAPAEEKLLEEARVHEKTQALLKRAGIADMGAVFEFYKGWREPIDKLKDVPREAL